MELFIRALELIPFFAKLGFDQDQAMMRHALFESITWSGLRVSKQPMTTFCRFGWNCDRNTCASGCIIIHERRCTHLGVNLTATGGTGRIQLTRECTSLITKSWELSQYFNFMNRFLYRKNKHKIVKILSKIP